MCKIAYISLLVAKYISEQKGPRKRSLKRKKKTASKGHRIFSELELLFLTPNRNHIKGISFFSLQLTKSLWNCRSVRTCCICNCLKQLKQFLFSVLKECTKFNFVIAGKVHVSLTDCVQKLISLFRSLCITFGKPYSDKKVRIDCRKNSLILQRTAATKQMSERYWRVDFDKIKTRLELNLTWHST